MPNKLTWRPATADDVGRLARFDDPCRSMATLGIILETVQRGDVLLFVANSHEYPLCEVQDVEAGDVEVMRMLLKASHHLLMGSIGPGDGPTSWIETRARLLDRMQPFIKKATQ